MASMNPLAGAQNTLKKAKDFTRSVENQAGNPSQYHAAYKARKNPTPKVTPKPSKTPGEDIASGLNAVRTNVDDYMKVYGSK